MGILVLGAVVAAALAITSAPAARTAPPPVALAGVSTSYAGTSWLWSGRALCQRDAPALGSGLVRRDARAASTPLTVPLVVVQALTAGPGGLMASGRDARCQPAALVSDDLGNTWRPQPHLAGARSLDASGPTDVWSVSTGDTAAVRRRERDVERPVRQPCPQGTEASLVSGRADETWLLCQDELGLLRTLAHTVDGGVAWNVPGNELSGTGLDGVGVVQALDLRQAPAGWLLKPARRCPEGELRTTVDGGDTWESLPCPRSTIPVAQVLTMTFSDATHGILAGVRGVRVVLASTADGGRSWTLAQ